MAAAAALWWLRGPAVEIYELSPRDFVQTVVASGRVQAPNRIEIGSVITGRVVKVLVEAFAATSEVATMQAAAATLGRVDHLRGFKENVRNGNSFVLANAELRFPVFTYLINSPIRSEVIRNFQFVG